MKFLAVSDLHYSDRPVSHETRRHALSLEKLKKCVAQHASDCDFIICMGDVADSFDGWLDQKQGFSQVNEVLRQAGKPVHTVIGNHDTAADKREFCRLMGMPNRYYAFDCEEYRCLVLDTNCNDVAVPYPNGEIEWIQCFLDEEQLAWLNETVAESEKPILLFSHALLRSEDYDQRRHEVKNSEKVRERIAQSDKIKAVFSAHYHHGWLTQIEQRPYVVFAAMCEEEACTCAVVEVTASYLSVDGFGKQESTHY
ncbi:MAG TPA: hypothetical protein DDY98_02735 [Ruminococcaceae bacterium]|nr:hypothetical protein [Oscillospiraceae bacterium]